MINITNNLGIIYLHTNLVNNKVYVGQSWQSIERRWIQHRSDAKTEKDIKTKSNVPFWRAIRKYGPVVWHSQILSYAQTQEELDRLERIWVILLKACDREFGYNVSNGGLGCGKWSEESRRKMSISKKGNTYCLGRVLSLETRQKQSIAASKRVGSKNPFYGKKHSEEAKNSIREARIGSGKGICLKTV